MGANPNATVAGVAGAITVLIVYIVGLVASVDIPAEVSAAITTIDIAVILFLGKNRRNANPQN